MRVAVICRDRPNSLDIRKANREAHLAYVRESGAVEIGGPFLNEDGDMCGSLLILSVDSLQDARDWAAGDPYAKAGLFASVSIDEWKQVIG